MNQDPIAFRLAHIKDPRDVAVIKAAAEKFGWETRPSPRRDQTGTIVSGRGIAYCQRSGTRVAVIAQVEIDRGSGRIWAGRFTVAHDCGLIINPDGLAKCIEGNIVQGISRTLWEEVTFDNNAVTSVDWLTYPILDITETPETIDVALINRPELPASGAGEPSIRPVAAAIANAIFDATGCADQAGAVLARAGEAGTVVTPGSEPVWVDDGERLERTSEAPSELDRSRHPVARRSVRLLADDLTGALDTAAELVGITGPLPVYWHTGIPAMLPRSAAIDSGTRERSARDASGIVTALAPLIAGADIAYKKIDSLLRGPTIAELAACLRTGLWDHACTLPGLSLPGSGDARWPPVRPQPDGRLVRGHRRSGRGPERRGRRRLSRTPRRPNAAWHRRIRRRNG